MLQLSLYPSIHPYIFLKSFHSSQQTLIVPLPSLSSPLSFSLFLHKHTQASCKMGNCLKHQSSCRYDSDDNSDDDWDFIADKGSFATVTTEVKIKISKKQLEELLSKVDVRELKVEQVLSQLMDHSGGFQSLQRPWRPALQSIPEDS